MTETPAASKADEAVRQGSLEEAMQTASNEVLEHATDLLAAGIQFTPEQLQAAAKLAAERVQKEHRAKEAQDPLVMIENVLQKAAQTDEEKSWAEAGAQSLSKFRKNWQEWYRLKKSAAQAKGNSIDLESEIKKTGEKPSFTNIEYQNPQNCLFNPVVGDDLLDWKHDGQQNVISIPKDFLDKVVTALCPTLSGLKISEAISQGVFPYGPKLGGKPYIESGGSNIKNLPGLTEGVAFTVYGYGESKNRLFVSMGVEALQKIIDFKPSTS